MSTIEVSKLILGNLDHEDGSRLYHAVKAILNKGDVASIDFSNVDIVTSSFLNTSFRILALDYDYGFLRSHVQIKNSNSSINRMIKNCLEHNSKEHL
ncbi:MAG: STAS-like domain-containing protein [Micavibrio sp.]